MLLKTKDNFYLYALSIAIPSIIQQLVTNLSQMVDNIMVGTLGEVSIASVAVSNQIFWIFMIALFGISGTANIFIAQYKGNNDNESITEVFRISLLFSIILGIVFFTILHFNPSLILRIFLKDQTTINTAISYIYYIKFTYLFFPISLIINSSLRVYGMVKLSMYVAFITVFTNIFFNYALIKGNLGFPELGVEGSAIATLIARIVEIIILISLVVIIKTPFKTRIRNIFKFKKSILLKFIQSGYALVLNEFLWALGMQMSNVLYTNRITENVAALNIASVINNMIFIGMGGMSVAVSIIIGNHLGISDYISAKNDSKKLFKLSFFLGILLGVFAIIFGFYLLSYTNLYNVNDDTLKKIYNIIFIAALFSGIYYLNACTFFIMRAGGDTKSVLIMDAGFIWVVVIPFIYLVGLFNPSMPIHYFIVQFLDFIKLFIARYRYRKDNWLVNLTSLKQISRTHD